MARDEIFDALPPLRARLGQDDFTPAEVSQELRSGGNSYSTIWTHVNLENVRPRSRQPRCGDTTC